MEAVFMPVKYATNVLNKGEGLVYKNGSGLAKEYYVVALVDRWPITDKDMFYDEREAYDKIYRAFNVGQASVRSDQHNHPIKYCRRVIATNDPSLTPCNLIGEEALLSIVSYINKNGKCPRVDELRRAYKRVDGLYHPIDLPIDWGSSTEIVVSGLTLS